MAFRGHIQGLTGVDLADPFFCATTGFKFVKNSLQLLKEFNTEDNASTYFFSDLNPVMNQCNFLNTPVFNLGSLMLYKDQLINHFSKDVNPFERAGVKGFVIVNLLDSLLKVYFQAVQSLPVHKDMFTINSLAMRAVNTASLVYQLMIISQ